MERRGETSSCHGSKISGDEQTFSTETAIELSNDGLPFFFLSAKVKRIIFFSLFSAIFATVFLRSGNFAAMAT